LKKFHGKHKILATDADKKKGEKFNSYKSTDRRILAADRSVGNMLEQAFAFFISLWAYALFVDPIRATNLGVVYVVGRSVK
jgi:hypothetical protein